MKKIELLIVFVHLSFASLMAQDTANQNIAVDVEARADSITEKMNQLLELNNEQLSSVQLTWKEYFLDIQTLQQNDQLGRRAFRKSSQRLEQQRNLKMKGILNEAQYEEYEVFLQTTKSPEDN